MWAPYHLDLPVDVPLFHVAEAPGLDSISSAGIHPDQTVVSDADQLLSLSTMEPAEKTIHFEMKVCSSNGTISHCERIKYVRIKTSAIY